MASNGRINRHRQALATRRKYLVSQIAEREALDLPCDYAKAERAALAYAEAVLEDAEAVGLAGRLGFLTVAERQLLRATVDALEERLAAV